MDGPRILLVAALGNETEDGVRSLRAAGCSVFLADSGAAALDVAENSELDAVLVDLEAPGIDAIAVAQDLRRQGRLARVPMLAVTSGSGTVLARALKAGYDGYVAEPVKDGSFWLEVSNVLQERLPPGVSRGSPDWRMSRGKVLIVEDEETNLQLLMFLLRQDGHEVFFAKTGEEAIELAREVVPDVAILDVLLPGEMSGYDVCRSMKADPALASVPVLIVSVLLDPRYRLTALDAGANDFLSKPIEAREITLRTRNYVYARRLRRSLERNLAELNRQQQMRESLAQMLVHDLRSPLTGIVAAIDLALLEVEGLVPPETRSLLTGALANTELMTRMVDTLLEVSRLEAGAFPLHPKETDLSSIVAQSVHILGDDAAGIDAHADEFLVVECDVDLLTRVVTNLLTNALAVSKTPQDVVIAGRMDAEDLRVEVLDRGPGVADADKSSIFDKFVQAGRGASRTGTSGLGLTFCRLVLEAHGGSIDVADREGGGAAFVFHLPRHAKASTAQT